MEPGALGKSYSGGETIIHQGDPTKGMFVIQEGEVEVLRELSDQRVKLAVLGKGDFFGQVPFFERKGPDADKARATVCSLAESRVLTVDKKTILRRIHEDPSLAYHIMQVMSRRMQNMEDEVARLIAKSLESS